MTAMPAEKWWISDREMEEKRELDRMIEMVTYYQELAFEYPTTVIYHRLLEVAQEGLREVEKKHCGRTTY